jgi:hypothetical protein
MDPVKPRSPVSGTVSLGGSSYRESKSLNGQNSLEEEKLMASQWARPYYLQCFSKSDDEALERAKSKSINGLRYALKYHNEFILPCLSWIMLILGQTERTRELADFLQACCDVIDEQRHLSDTLAYAVPFRYALAWARDEEEQMDQTGESLERSHNQIRQIWGDDHPNIFVSGYFYSFHLLRRGGCNQVIALLTPSLSLCERRMGRYNLLTISCLAVLSRAHAEMGDTNGAVDFVRKAMVAARYLELIETDVRVVRPVLQRFRLSLLVRHADLILTTDDSANAEKQLWRVLQIRGLLYGLSSVDTWNAAQSLGVVLKATGKITVWEGLLDYLQKQYAWEQDRDWYLQQGRQPPPPPPPPACLQGFQLQA